MIGYIRKLTPNFRLNFALRSIQLTSVVIPRMKDYIDNHDWNSIVYEFKCNCQKIYIGETRRRLRCRIMEHGRPSVNSVVHKHIKSCGIYQNEFLKFDPGGKPGPKKA